MAHYIAYKILPKLRCVVEYYWGELSLRDLLAYQKKVAEDTDYNPSFNIISDFRESTIKGREQDVVKFIDYITTHRPLAKRQSAVLTHTPNQFVIGQLYTMHLGDLPMNVTVISTVEAALTWVGLSMSDKKLIEETIWDLNNNREVILQ